jgi:uroporphyrinogen-III synthase
LRNFVELIGAAGEAHLKRTPLFVPHFRIAEVARSLGCERVVETLPGDEGLAAGLARFWAKM